MTTSPASSGKCWPGGTKTTSTCGSALSGSRSSKLAMRESIGTATFSARLSPDARRSSTTESSEGNRAAAFSHGTTPKQRQPVNALDRLDAVIEQRDVAAELVDEIADDHAPVLFRQDQMGAGDRGDDAAAIDVADEDHRHVGARRKAHIGNVAAPQIDLGRRAGAFDDDEVGTLADLGPGVEHGIHQTGFQRLVVACPRLAEHLALHHHLRADIGLRLEQHRVHMDGGRNATGDRLQPLGAADLAAEFVARYIGDGGVVRHVLRLERPHLQPTVPRRAAEARDQHRLADIGACALQHDRLGRH